MVTGGCGYIGSHTLVDLIDNGFDVLSIDNNSRSNPEILERVERITGRPIRNFKVDLCDFRKTKNIFQKHKDIKGIIHFAAFKTVHESVENPLLYYHNNLNSLLNLLQCVEEFKIPWFVFSSSCSVYGNAKQLPVTEKTPFGMAESPYAHTKQIGEDMISHFAKRVKTNFINLRYFNPAGAHATAAIGESQWNKPQNLVPVITHAAIKKKKLIVHGSDYPTRDGSCVRDYIHVMDVAHAHTLALGYLIKKKMREAGTPTAEVFNLGLGNGVTVLEAINTFEKVTGVKLHFTIGPRRKGDVAAIYSDNKKAAKILGWKPLRSLEDIMLSAWHWEQERGL